MLGNLLARLFSKRSARHRKRAANRHEGRRLIMESLEDRALLSTVDLRPVNSIGMANGALFIQYSQSGSGSGTIHSFLQVQSPGNGTEEKGYNTSNPLRPQFNEGSSATFNHDVQLGSFPKLNIAGREYREFVMDGGEPGSTTDVSLQELRVFVSATPNRFGYNLLTNQLDGMTAVFDLDLGPDGNSRVDIRSNNNSGNGSADMLAMIPESAFAGANAASYVYVYCRFGVPNDTASNDVNGFGAQGTYEEWAYGDASLLNPLAEVHGYKFEDMNGNGVDDEDPRKDGVTIYMDANLNGQLDPSEATSVTGPNGEYGFTGLVAGLPAPYNLYPVREVVPTGWTQTAGGADIVLLNRTDGGKTFVAYSGEAPIPVIPGGNTPYQEVVVPTLAFGNFHNLVITGTKFEDHDGDGVREDGDQGIPDWPIQLTGTKTVFIGANGLPLAAPTTAPVTLNTTTDENGDYSFNVGPGSYSVQEVQDPDWTQTYGNAGYGFIVPGDNYPSGSSDSGNDFGNFENVTLSGHKYEDPNNNRQHDDGEVGLAGWRIYIDANNNGALDEGETYDDSDEFGDWSIDNVGPGTHVLREVMQFGWGQTYGPGAVTTSSGEDVFNLDFGNSEGIVISGQKFYDADTDGTKDEGEVGVAGFTIYLDGNDNGLLDWVDAGELNGVWDAGEGEQWTKTDAAGNYSFSLLGGTFLVREVITSLPGTWVQTTANPGPISTTTENVDFGNVSLGGIGAHTKGFWQSKNGEKLITGDDLALLSSMNLRNADGSDFNPVSVAELQTWITAPTANGNMAMILSQQLAAMVLNVQHLVSPSSLIYAPGSDSANAAGFAPISAIIAEADLALASDPDGLIFSGDSNHAYCELLKDILDDGNNDLTWVLPWP